MKPNNGAVAAVLGMGIFVTAPANLQVFALNVANSKAATGITLSQHDVSSMNTAIHEETVSVTFDRTGVVCCDGSLDKIDKNAVPNF